MMDEKNSEVITHAIESRRSVRGFLPKPIDRALLSRILSTASYAPSGSNIQPWQVHVVEGETRDALSNALVQAHYDKKSEAREYEYYPTEWRSPYIERRRETGWGLYGTLGIKKGDQESSSKQHARNYEFFDAPTVLVFTIDNDLGKGSWLDYGMFLQSIMIAARGHGLHSCPQAALANFPATVKQHLQIDDNRIVVCGISIGYEDPECLANTYRPDRIGLEQFVVFHE